MQSLELDRLMEDIEAKRYSNFAEYKSHYPGLTPKIYSQARKGVKSVLMTEGDAPTRDLGKSLGHEISLLTKVDEKTSEADKITTKIKDDLHHVAKLSEQNTIKAGLITHSPNVSDKEVRFAKEISRNEQEQWDRSVRSMNNLEKENEQLKMAIEILQKKLTSITEAWTRYKKAKKIGIFS